MTTNFNDAPRINHLEVNPVNTTAPESTHYSEVNTVNTTVVEGPKLVSLLDLSNEPDQPAQLAGLTIPETEPALVTLFTDQGVRVTSHYLPKTGQWDSGFYHCLGLGCPACAAEMSPQTFVLLPVVDRTDGEVKIVRVRTEKGPGKLLTELSKVLSLSNRGNIITKISRKNYQYSVEAVREESVHPDLATAIKQFLEQLAAKIIDITSVVPRIPASEMLQHEHVAKRLEAMGVRPPAASCE
jgi:hypothetical protein